MVNTSDSEGERFSQYEFMKDFLYADAHIETSPRELKETYNQLFNSKTSPQKTQLENKTIDTYSPHLNQIFEEFFRSHRANFQYTDLITIHGGPNEKEEKQRYESLEKILPHLEDKNETTILDTLNHLNIEEELENPEDYQIIKKKTQNTLEEVIETYATSKPHDIIISITSDYHVPRTEKYMSQGFADNDYLIAGAQTHEDEFSEYYREKWISEAVRTAIPQKWKDFGKDRILPLKNKLK